jgi:hypothetical protein
MAQSVSDAFTATGNGTVIIIRQDEKFTYTVTGSFVGTYVIEESEDGGITWTQIATGTTTASATTVTHHSKRGTSAQTRSRCSAYTSGTMTVALAELTTEVISEFRDKSGSQVLSVTEGGLNVTGNIVRTSQTIIYNEGKGKVGGTSGWAVGAAADTGYLATMAASQTAGTYVVPIGGMKVGSTITGFHVIGQIESAGGAVTLDADLRKHTAVAADPTDASVGAITQLSVTADTKVDNENAAKTGLTEVVAQDETFYVLLTGTTAASTDIIILGVGVTYTET